MSNNRYLEIDSSYRNREEFPNPSNFTVLIAQSGTRGKLRAYDPVSDAAPIIEWTASGILSGTTVANIANTTTRFLACFPPIAPIQPSTTPRNQRLNYYRGLPITIGADNTLIVSSEYTSTVGGSECFWITVLPALSAVPGVAVVITLTQIFDTTNGLFWVPTSFSADEFYTESVLWNDNITVTNQSVPILSYDGDTHTVGVDPLLVGDWVGTDTISIRRRPPQVASVLPSQVAPVPVPPLTSNQVVIPPTLSGTYQYYTGSFIRFSSGANEGISCRITDYTGGLSVKPGTDVPPGDPDNPPVPINPYTVTFQCKPGVTLVPLVAGDGFEILQFTRDNAVPFDYTGSLVSQQEMVCYEIELINLVIPNTTLESGGRVAFYPYVYVELQNVSGASSGTNSIIYSNNPNARRMLFRAAMDDIANPVLAPFIKIDGDGMVQTVKFKPNDNLKFGVYLPNGDPLETVIKDSMSPAIPDPLVQVSAMFSIRRL